MMPRSLVNVPVLVVDAWPVLEWFYKRSPVVNLFTNEPYAKLWMERNQFGQAQVQALKGRYIPAQGGGGWRAFFARRVAATLGYEPNEARALKGRDIVQPEMLAIPMDRSANATNSAKSSNLSLHWLGV